MGKKKVVGTIEARMGATRLPGKTLMKVYEGYSLLELVVSRFKLCQHVDEVYVATTNNKADDDIVKWCEEHNVCFYRGSEENVLDRVAMTSINASADCIVQMGADSAYLDFKLIDELISLFQEGNYDYVCNDIELTYPLGVYGHVVRAKTLIELNKKKTLTTQDRDDVVRYIWEHPDEYNILNVIAPEELRFPHLRLTIDYPEDLQLAKELYDYFQSHDFSTREILSQYQQRPDIFGKTLSLVQKQAPFMSRVKGYKTIIGSVR